MKLKKQSVQGMANMGYLGHFAKDKFLQQGHNDSGSMSLVDSIAKGAENQLLQAQADAANAGKGSSGGGKSKPASNMPSSTKVESPSALAGEDSQPLEADDSPYDLEGDFGIA